MSCQSIPYGRYCSFNRYEAQQEHEYRQYRERLPEVRYPVEPVHITVVDVPETNPISADQLLLLMEALRRDILAILLQTTQSVQMVRRRLLVMATQELVASISSDKIQSNEDEERGDSFESLKSRIRQMLNVRPEHEAVGEISVNRVEYRTECFAQICKVIREEMQEEPSNGLPFVVTQTSHLRKAFDCLSVPNGTLAGTRVIVLAPDVSSQTNMTEFMEALHPLLMKLVVPAMSEDAAKNYHIAEKQKQGIPHLFAIMITRELLPHLRNDPTRYTTGNYWSCKVNGRADLRLMVADGFYTQIIAHLLPSPLFGRSQSLPANPNSFSDTRWLTERGTAEQLLKQMPGRSKVRWSFIFEDDAEL
jgi:hypothetical protein